MLAGGFTAAYLLLAKANALGWIGGAVIGIFVGIIVYLVVSKLTAGIQPVRGVPKDATKAE